MDLSLKFGVYDIRLFMKAKGLFSFWMVEHDYCLRWKFLNAKSFKGVKLQENRTSFGQERYIIAGFSPLGYGVIIGFNWNIKRQEWSMGQVIYV